jgi:glycosyltransferase involved in cell wall biosynthesis
MHLNNSENNLRCALIYLGPFPIGNVSSIRILSYCKALAKKGVFIKVLILAPTREAKVNEEVSGIYEGVHYQYMTKITWKNANVSTYIKVVYYLLGLLKSLKYIRKDKINCLLSYHSNLLSNFFFWIVTRSLSIPFLLDKTEYPYGYNKMSAFSKKIARVELLFYDGFIVISKELEAFYKKIKTNIFHMPMTIDMDRFKGYKRNKVASPYIAVVFGVHNRDGLYESIVAYKKYCDLSSENAYRLVLIGNYNNLPDKNKIDTFIQNNHLQDKIEIKGLVPINKVPQLLIDADCLLTTPNEYVSGGFPTKLGEYMLSGVPVVATNAGEVGNYVTHMEDILISQPGELDNVATNILFIQQNKAMGLIFAENARNRAKEFFNADNYVNELISFINKISKTNIHRTID